MRWQCPPDTGYAIRGRAAVCRIKRPENMLHIFVYIFCGKEKGVGGVLVLIKEIDRLFMT